MRQLAVKQKTTSTNILPKITNNQIKIIKEIYKFRFINTNQFQKFFNHKDPTTITRWLKDLKEKGYINTDYKRTDIAENRRPARYFLAPLGRRFLKGQKGFDIKVLKKVYKEKNRKPVFKNHCEEIVDMYLFLRFQKGKNEELKFFTDSNLAKYTYFPETEFDAYIVMEENNKIRRFLLHIFKESDPTWLPRQKIRDYIKYFNDNTWQENTDNSPFPALLFVLPTDSFKFHIFKYGKAVLQKAITVDIQLFVETKQALKTGDPKKLWQKVD